MKKPNRRGFTIVELVIVIAVIGLIITAMMPALTGVTETANESAALQEAQAAYKEVLAQDLADGSLPKSGNGTIYGEYSYESDGTQITRFEFKAKNGYTVVFENSVWTVNP